jgi:hypothetical protein
MSDHGGGSGGGGGGEVGLSYGYGDAERTVEGSLESPSSPLSPVSLANGSSVEYLNGRSPSVLS